ncbi:MAG: DUF465 domain-containing protein [Xanthomonadales bacterium]|nr:DUF465 domain-containing protein [Xanthomonadales bacterium]
MDLTDPALVAMKLAELRLEHRDLNDAIDRISGDRVLDELSIKRLKKRRLKLKDMITYLENLLIPDLNA